MGLTCGFIFKILKYHQSFQILHFRRKNIFTHKIHIQSMWYNAMNCNLNNKIVYFHSHAVNTRSNEDYNTHGIGTAQLGIVIYIYTSSQVFPTQFHFPKSTVFPSVCNRSNICDSVHLILCDSDTSLIKTDGVSVSCKNSLQMLYWVFFK